MARFEKSRPKSAKPHAAVAPARPRSSAPTIEDTMFFPRLRRHAKWMFVLLALVFGLGFSSSVSAPAAWASVTSSVAPAAPGRSRSPTRAARPRTAQRPGGLAQLATAYETEGETAEAITALNKAIELDPRTPSAPSRAGRAPPDARHRAAARRPGRAGGRLPRPGPGVPAAPRPVWQSVLSTRSRPPSTRRERACVRGARGRADGGDARGRRVPAARGPAALRPDRPARLRRPPSRSADGTTG